MMKTTKYILATALLSSALFFSACGGKDGSKSEASDQELPYQERVDKYIKSLTAADTTEVLTLCSSFLTELQDGHVDEAARSLYQVDSLGQARPVTEETIQSLRRRTRLFPVVSYSFEEMSFFLPLENTVTYKVVFRQSTPPATMGWGFRPVKIDDKWYLTLLEASKN